MATPTAMTAQSPLSLVFIVHILLEAPLAIQGLWAAQHLPFLDMTNTTLVILKLYSALILGSCVAALLCFSLPEFLPGKRAFGIALFLYHVITSTILLQAPRFVPMSLGAAAESFSVTPEKVWGSLHGFLGLFFMTWWQGTVQYAAAARQVQTRK